MGVEPAIAHDRFPQQGSLIGQKVLVAFNYDTGHVLQGVVVRDDGVPPWRMIIRIEREGELPRYVLATECQWRPDSAEGWRQRF